MGRALRGSLRVPTDTYITGDIPLLLTLLSKVPGVPEQAGRRDATAFDLPQSRKSSPPVAS